MNASCSSGSSRKASWPYGLVISAKETSASTARSAATSSRALCVGKSQSLVKDRTRKRERTSRSASASVGESPRRSK